MRMVAPPEGASFLILAGLIITWKYRRRCLHVSWYCCLWSLCSCSKKTCTCSCSILLTIHLTMLLFMYVILSCITFSSLKGALDFFENFGAQDAHLPSHLKDFAHWSLAHHCHQHLILAGTEQNHVRLAHAPQMYFSPVLG